MASSNQPTAYGRIFPPRADWLAKAPAEAILEPDLPIVDTHHHVWPDRGRYMLDELLADTGSGHNVEATVFIECRQSYRTDGPQELRSVGEVAYVADLADAADAKPGNTTRVAAGIVGYADLTLADRVEPVLAALAEAGRGRFKGVRNSAGWHADPIIGNNHHGAGPGHYLRADFHAGLNRMTAMGFSLDALVFHHQHADLLALARACPEANIIMNHTGMPLGYGPFAGQQKEVYATWRQLLPEIAACPNVTMKLGGMMMRLASFDYNAVVAPPSSAALADQWRPYIEPCIELFGAERCTFESNFPVDKMGIGYAPLWNAFKRIAAKASAAEKRALFGGTARRIYRLS
ncbi:MAG: amidohydrolase family protein [Hyphomicrobiaceae bacterium]